MAKYDPSNVEVTSAFNAPVRLEGEEVLIDFIRNEILPAADKLLELLLFFRGKPFCLSGVNYSESDVDQKLKEIYNSVSIVPEKAKRFGVKDASDFAFDQFKDEAQKLYKFFIGEESPDDGNKIKQAATSFYAIFFAKATGNRITRNIPSICSSSLFPIASFANCNLGASITAEVERKIKSFEELQKLRNEEYTKLNNAGDHNPDGEDDGSETIFASAVVDVRRFCQSLYENSKTYGFKEFGKENIKSVSEFLSENVEQLRSIFAEKGGNFSFEDEADLSRHKIVTGYKANFVNAIYSDFDYVWKSRPDVEDVYEDKKRRVRHKCLMTDRRYVKLALDLCKFIKKREINVSRFGDKGGLPCLLLGANYIGYRLEERDGNFFIRLTDLTSKEASRSAPKMDVRILPNGYLNNFKVIEGDHSKGIYTISYNTARSSEHTEIIETTYTGTIKEPRLRYDRRAKRITVDLCITNVQSSNNALDKVLMEEQKKVARKIHFDLGVFFKTSYSEAVLSKKGRQLPFDRFRVMGVDLGLNPIAALAMYDVCKDDNGYDIGGTKLSWSYIGSHKAKNIPVEDIRKIDKVTNMAKSVKSLIGYARQHLAAIKAKKFGKKAYEVDIAYAETKVGKLLRDHTMFSSVEEYLKDVESRLANIPPIDWKKRQTGWVVPSLLAKVKEAFSEMRSGYNNAKDKRDYVRTRNFACTKDLRKIEATKAVLSLSKSFTFLGLSDDEKNSIESFGESMNDYINGLRMFFSKNLAAMIVHHAIKNNINVIFVEDLDAKAAYHLTQEENCLKQIWATSTIMKYLKQFALKHRIVVVLVKPDFTSQIDSETGEFGYRDKQNKSRLYMNGPVPLRFCDADINAAKNVALRGIKRHTDIPSFRAVQLSESEYLYELQSEGTKQRQGTLMKSLNTVDRLDGVIFKLEPDGTFTLDAARNTKDLKEKADEFRKSQDPKNEKPRTEFRRSGSRWYRREDLEKVIEGIAGKVER
ncbi:MAG: hypothetical protein HC888_04575 [Candidatus Competibacteraceae bacterium]|nr:hypothetical protein [Candidatus Competibacteraceae bacterium]